MYKLLTHCLFRDLAEIHAFISECHMTSKKFSKTKTHNGQMRHHLGQLREPHSMKKSIKRRISHLGMSFFLDRTKTIYQKATSTQCKSYHQPTGKKCGESREQPVQEVQAPKLWILLVNAWTILWKYLLQSSSSQWNALQWNGQEQSLANQKILFLSTWVPSKAKMTLLLYLLVPPMHLLVLWIHLSKKPGHHFP